MSVYGTIGPLVYFRIKMKSTLSYSFILLLVANSAVPAYGGWKGKVVGGVLGAGAVIVGAPVVLGAAGFGAAGIAAGSMGASMMAASAPVAAGSTVAILQSAGAAGVAIGTKVAGAAVGAAIGDALEDD